MTPVIPTLPPTVPFRTYPTAAEAFSATAQGEMFQREWFEIVDALPAGLRPVRYWDLASSVPKPGALDPDWTAEEYRA